MDAITLLRRQVATVTNALQELCAGMSLAEWTARAAPGQNLVGFTAWHIPAVQDWALNTWCQGQPPLRSSPEWAASGIGASLLAFGMTASEADAIARATTPGAVADYAGVVGQALDLWLAGLSESDLDAVPDNRRHLDTHRAYDLPGYREEVEGMFEQQLWRLLSGACIGHCRGHLGELDAALASLRART